MSLLEMSLTGSVMIVVVFLLRSLLLHRLPKKTFVILWGIVAIRLLVPVQIASRWSVYSMIPETWMETVQDGEALVGRPAVNVPENVGNGYFLEGGPVGDEGTDYQTDPVKADQAGTVYAGVDHTGADIVGAGNAGTGSYGAENVVLDWAVFVGRAGSLLCAGWFLAVYLSSRRKFAESLPVQNVHVEEFLAAHRLRRKISVRRLGGIRTPLTYGVWRPVILFPDKIDWTNKTELEFMLLHEYVHIRHFDALLKLVVTAVLCVHWFNPLVWLLYIQCNRDIELSCDETVVHISGRQFRDNYAMTLISMAERKIIPAPLCNGFSENALEERIEAIMLTRGLSVKIGVVAVLLVAAVAVLFATTEERADIFAGMPLDGQNDQMQSPVEIDNPMGDVSGADIGDAGADEAIKRAELDEEIERAERQKRTEQAEQQDYAIKYFPEGIPEEIPAQVVRGNGYRMLFPVDEKLVSNAPWGFTYSHNENIFLRVIVYEGMSAEQAGALLAGEGYHETDNGDYRIQTEKEDVQCAEVVRLVEDVYSTYSVSYGFPDTSEYEENVGAYLAAVASTFTLDTAGLSGDGAALKEAAKSFGDAYLAGDGVTCLKYMSSEADASCLQELSRGKFDFSGARAKRLCIGAVEELQDGEETELQIECSNPEDGEGNVYLGITFRKEAGAMKVVFFGWEM